MESARDTRTNPARIVGDTGLRTIQRAIVSARSADGVCSSEGTYCQTNFITIAMSAQSSKPASTGVPGILRVKSLRRRR